MQDQAVNDNANNRFKTLLLVRHAKSSWEAGTPSDFERPLNERGFRDAPVMAARLKEKDLVPAKLVSSPAKRAKTTAILFAEVFKFSQQEITMIPSLYHADTQLFFEVVSSLDNAFNSVAIFSHNPGITAFANLLTEKVHIDNMPTCSIFGLKVFTDSWADFASASKEFLLFDYPKNQ